MENRGVNNSTFKNFVIGPPYTLHHSDSGNFGHGLRPCDLVRVLVGLVTLFELVQAHKGFVKSLM